MSALCAAFAGKFRPRLFATLLMLVLVAVFIRLGQWQWDKAERKSSTQAQLDSRGVQETLPIPALPIAAPESFHYRRVTVSGRYRPQGQILLDNQVHQEQAGYRVLTPFVIEGSRIEVLVDRGWIAAPMDRNILPAVAVTDAPRVIAGTAVVPSRRHFTLAEDTAPPGHDARWQVIDLERYARTAGVPLQPVLIRLDPAAADGYLRVWPRPDKQQERNLGYAYQWFGFAVSSVLIWVWTGWRRKA